jgi:hypothetical protein
MVVRVHNPAIGLLLAAGVLCACSSSDNGKDVTTGGGSTAAGGIASNGGGAPGTAGAALGSGGSAAAGAFAGAGPALNGGSGGASTAASGGASGRGGMGGASSALGGGAGAGTGGGTPSLANCPALVAGAPDNAVTAINAVNTIRLAMGVECAKLVLDLDASAKAHCDFYAGNTGNAMCEGGSISPHNEVTGCTGFTGADPGARVKAAGYVGNGWGEVMAFNDDPLKAVNQWVGSVWHRTPLLSPWWDDMGYGNATKCDVIDLGPGTQSAKTVTAMYPYAGQTNVTRSFNGANEGPVPPAPPTGWPSGLPITLYVRNAVTVSHSIEVMGSGMPLTHQWIDYNQSDNDTDQLIMYTDAPFAANTTYHVTIAVTISGAAKTFDWTFTTGG